MSLEKNFKKATSPLSIERIDNTGGSLNQFKLEHLNNKEIKKIKESFISGEEFNQLFIKANLTNLKYFNNSFICKDKDLNQTIENLATKKGYTLRPVVEDEIFIN